MSNRNARRPKAQTSVAGETRAPASACSGAIHRGVPTAAVSCCAARASATSLAIPKSRTFTTRLRSRWCVVAMKTFSGFRSRWTTPARWAAPSACPICPRMGRASAVGSAPRSRRYVARSRPSRSSIAIHGVSVAASMPAERTSTMCSLSIREATRASCSKRSRVLGSRVNSLFRSLSARCLPVDACSATYTEPIPPSASRRTTWKSPAKTSPGRRAGTMRMLDQPRATSAGFVVCRADAS